mgnify:CR=1 FL=1
MVNILFYSLRVVNESVGRYNLDKKIKRPENAVSIFEEVLHLSQRTEEIFAMLTVNIKNQVTGVFVVSQGTLNASQVHPREVFKRALLQNAAAIIVAHNHPSGITAPSGDDKKITERLINAGEVIGVNVLDHLILGDDSFYSLRENGDVFA